ncbi:ComEC/Rec2 family competence protein [Massilia sp. 2TAF26]
MDGQAIERHYVQCAALALVVLLDPWAMLWPGFWLSFGAVAVILFGGYGGIGLRGAGVKEKLRTAWCR